MAGALDLQVVAECIEQQQPAVLASCRVSLWARLSIFVSRER